MPSFIRNDIGFQAAKFRGSLSCVQRAARVAHPTAAVRQRGSVVGFINDVRVFGVTVKEFRVHTGIVEMPLASAMR